MTWNQYITIWIPGFSPDCNAKNSTPLEGRLYFSLCIWSGNENAINQPVFFSWKEKPWSLHVVGLLGLDQWLLSKIHHLKSLKTKKKEISKGCPAPLIKTFQSVQYCWSDWRNIGTSDRLINSIYSSLSTQPKNIPNALLLCTGISLYCSVHMLSQLFP